MQANEEVNGKGRSGSALITCNTYVELVLRSDSRALMVLLYEALELCPFYLFLSLQEVHGCLSAGNLSAVGLKDLYLSLYLHYHNMALLPTPRNIFSKKKNAISLHTTVYPVKIVTTPFLASACSI